MSVTPIEGTPPVSGQPLEFTTGTGAASEDKEMFLQLLVAQMRYQDPMNPTESSEFLSQSAQFTALEKMSAVAEQTAQLVALQVSFGASSMVGRTVSYPLEDGTTASGTVNAVRFTSDGPVLTVDGLDVPFAEVIGVGDGTTDLLDLPTPDTDTDPTDPTTTA